MYKLPKNIIFQILSNNTDNAVINFSLTSKWYHNIILENSDFWRYRILNKFGQFLFAKPDDLTDILFYKSLVELERVGLPVHNKPHQLTFAEFYERLIESGDLIGSPHTLIAKNIHTVLGNSELLYYIDVLGNLYDHGLDTNNPLAPIFENQSVIPNVRDVSVSENWAIILTLDYKLHVIGEYVNSSEKLILLQENVRKFDSCQFVPFFLYITTDNKLFAQMETRKFEYIDDNVKDAYFVDEYSNEDDDDPYVYSIYYLKYDGYLMQYKPNLILHKFKDLNMGFNSFEAGDYSIFRSKIPLVRNVKQFAINVDYIALVTDTLKIVPRKLFEASSYYTYDVDNTNPSEGFSFKYKHQSKPKNDEYANIKVLKLFASNWNIYIIDENHNLYKLNEENMNFEIIDVNVLNLCDGFSMALSDNGILKIVKPK